MSSYKTKGYEITSDGTNLTIRTNKGEKKLNLICGGIEEKLPNFLADSVRRAGGNPPDYFSFNATPIRFGALNFVRDEVKAARSKLAPLVIVEDKNGDINNYPTR